MPPAAIKATWSTYKPVPTRNVLQLVLEVPLEEQERVFKCLGFPVSGKETWVGVALLDIDRVQEKPRKSWVQMSYAQRSGILRNDERFQQWARAADPGEAANYIRRACKVQSCSEIDGDADAILRFETMDRVYRQSTGQMAEQR